MTTEPQQILIQIFDAIDDRVSEIVKAQPAWPCRQGCALCCRRLPHLPEITKTEWELLGAGIQELPPDIQTTVRRRISELGTGEVQGSFITCPLLDREIGECLVYAQRPAACRMYGYYVTRSSSRWCEMIQARYEAGFAEGIVLGNQQAVDGELARRFGGSRSIEVWWAE
ncbi:MAG: YkgJ family cysteine cluster protein [Chloroflexota bacterium]